MKKVFLFSLILATSQIMVAQKDSKIRAIELLSEKRVRQELNDSNNSRQLKIIVETVSEIDSLTSIMKVEYDIGTIHKELLKQNSNSRLQKLEDYKAIVNYDSLMAKIIYKEIDSLHIQHDKILKDANDNLDSFRKHNLALNNMSSKKIIYYFSTVILLDKYYEEKQRGFQMKFSPTLSIYNFEKID